MKIQLMYQGQGFNATSQGNSGQRENHTRSRQAIFTLKSFKNLFKNIF